MDRLEAMTCAVTLGRRFVALDMELHARLLRGWYAAVRDGRASPPDYRATVSKGTTWHLGWVRHWLGLFRLPPCEWLYRLARSCRCDGAGVYRAAIFPGGKLWACADHGSRWLELEPAFLGATQSA